MRRTQANSRRDLHLGDQLGELLVALLVVRVRGAQDRHLRARAGFHQHLDDVRVALLRRVVQRALR